MDESKPAAEKRESGSVGASGVLAAASGLTTVGIGVGLAATYPVLASVLVGLPLGFGVWAGLREAAGRTVGWPLSDADATPVDSSECARSVPEEDCPA
jgi:hypothetical protein